MAKPFHRFRRFLSELKRRNVYRVAVAYLAVAFVGLQAARLLVPPTTLPGWADDLLIYLAVFGFPIALVLAWAFEMSAEGVRRTPGAAPSVKSEGEPAKEKPGTRRAVGILAALGVIAVAGAGIWQFTPLGGDEGTAHAPPRIAVLPFEESGGDTANASFTNGMHEEVWYQLSKVSGLDVISRTSVRGYTDSDKRLPEITRELGGVDAVLEGSVRRSGDQVRITITLIEAPEDRDLWSSTYQRRLAMDEIFQIQANIAERVAGALETELALEERQRIESAPTDDLAAYDAYLAGRNQWWQIWRTRDARHVDFSVERLLEAVARDSTFAEAHAWLALSYGARYTVTGESRWLDSAVVRIDRAEHLAPHSAIVRGTRGHIHFWQDSFAAAERALEGAVKLQPSNSLAVSTLAIVNERQNDRTEQVRWAERAVRLDPRRAEFAQMLGYALRAVGFDGEAEAWMRKARALEPDYVFGLEALSRFYLLHGEVERARSEVETFLDAHPSQYDALAAAAEVSVFASELRRAKTYLERAERARQEQYPRDSPTRPNQISLEIIDRMNLGLVEMRLGNEKRGTELLAAATDSFRVARLRGEIGPPEGHALEAAGLAALGRRHAALRHLERAVEAGYPFQDWIRAHPLYENLRSEARFQEIVRQARKNQKRFQRQIREEVDRLGLDPYPPGAEPDAASSRVQSSG